jgi:hypothetical protein
MCRSCAEGQRRCGSDTSEKRRQRRKAKIAISCHTATQPNRNVLEVIPNLNSWEDIKEEQRNVRELIHTPPLDNVEAQDAYDAKVELRVTALGKALAEEAEKRAGFNLQEFKDKYDVTSEELDEATETWVMAEDEMETVKAELESFDGDKESDEYKELKSNAEKTFEDYTKAAAIYEAASAKDDAIRGAIHDEQVAKLTAAYRGVIADLRDCGGEVEATDDSDPDALKVLQETVGTHYPAEWLKASNEQNDRMRMIITENRAHYRDMADQDDLIGTENNPTDKVYGSFFSTPVPVDKIDKALELLGEDAVVMDGRPLLVNDDVCRMVQLPHHLIFDPTIHPMKEDGTPNEEGWTFEHYIEPSTGAVSENKKWVKKTPLVEKVRRPQILVKNDSTSVNGQATAYHEFAHRVESVVADGAIMRQEEAWLRRRTTNPETGVREDNSAIYPRMPGQSMIDMEIGRRNSFFHHYVGKEYIGSNHREVLSMGAESIFAGTNSALMGLSDDVKADHDHKGFILGIFATA